MYVRYISRYTFSLAIGMFLFALVLWICYLALALSDGTSSFLPELLRKILLLPKDVIEPTVLARRGQFGDAFGAFNALMSALALAGLLITFDVQRRQLQAQHTQTASEMRLIGQQQFQEQFYRAIDAYKSLLVEFRTNDSYTGRAGLHEVWRDAIRTSLASDNGALRDVVTKQLELRGKSGAELQRATRELREAIADLWSQAKADSALMTNIMDRISECWSNLYFTHRFQLDAVFRTWYTVYRVLDTASKDVLTDEVIWLYGADFRAQLSWIELAYLLVNQSALDRNPSFEKACKLSNGFAVFDNLAEEDDVVVFFLSRLAKERAASLSATKLNSSAFSSDTRRTLGR